MQYSLVRMNVDELEIGMFVDSAIGFGAEMAVPLEGCFVVSSADITRLAEACQSVWVDTARSTLLAMTDTSKLSLVA